MVTILNWLKRPPDFTIQDNYLLRWHIIPRNKWFNIYLHNIRHSDDDRALHDHPWYNISIILKGSYIEVTPNGRFKRTQGSIIFRKATGAHRLEINSNKSTWTLFITGPIIREWGFHCEKGWVVHYEFLKAENPGEIGRGCE